MGAHKSRVRNLDRDRWIILDQQAGMSYRTLAAKHKLSASRAHEIVKTSTLTARTAVAGKDGPIPFRTGARYQYVRTRRAKWPSTSNRGCSVHLRPSGSTREERLSLVSIEGSDFRLTVTADGGLECGECGWTARPRDTPAILKQGCPSCGLMNPKEEDTWD